MSESLFFVKLPPVQQLCHTVLQVSNEKLDFHLQVLKCRQLLSICSSIIAAPQIENRTVIDAIVHVDFYKKKFGLLCRKFNLKPLQTAIAKNIFIEQCLLYTIKFKLSPQWNQVGSLLVANSDFLLCHGKLEAVKLDITVREEEMIIKIKTYMIRMPPPKLENFGICPQALEMFSEDQNYNIPECAINLEWCHILPTMKKGQLIKISHKMPPNSTNNSFLNNFEGLRKYWKIQYGYCLPENEDDMIYCSVYFKQIDSILFTYPLICLRNKPIQFMPRCDDPGTTKKFFDDLRQKFNQVCGLPIVFGSKACSSTNTLSVASKLKPGLPQNVCLVDGEKTLSSSLLRKVPNENMIMATQNLSETKDFHYRVVPSIGEKVDIVKKNNNLSCFPTTSEGKYIPVFNVKTKKPNEFSCKKFTSGTTQDSILASSVISKKKPLADIANKKSLHKRQSNATKDPSRPTLKKHKFDELFSSASSALLQPQAVADTCLKNHKTKKHQFDELFKSASSISGVTSSKSAFQNPTLSKTKPPPRKRCQFDELFKPASTSCL